MLVAFELTLIDFVHCKVKEFNFTGVYENNKTFPRLLNYNNKRLVSFYN